ncbi:MAG: nucleoside deaminase [Muribaculaceae bacterium]|nr:nucleoside deaminase [Muribaculaceae bacterium]
MIWNKDLSDPRDEFYMLQALNEAVSAFEENEVPVGAIVVCNGKIIGRGHNQTQKLNDVTAHAEIIALTAAENNLGAKYLPDCTLYVTVEPCIMCAGAIGWSRIGRLVYGCDDAKRGFTLFCRENLSPLHPSTIVSKGILEDEARELMSEFFKQKRR